MKRKSAAPALADSALADSAAEIPVDAFREALLAHYDSVARELPWRGEADPYRILVSEVMLQQTRVETVKKYYEPWLERFPDAETLAAADEDDVLKAWEGLGYYRRARNLHRAARVVRERADRAFPSRAAELRALPGVGEYTAGAVASIAFGEAEPAVDGNVRRVLSRLFDRPEPRPAWLRRAATAVLDPDRPGDWNQALMELGATVCTPAAPACDGCPVSAWCASLAAGTVEERPGRAARREARRATFVLGVFHQVDEPERVLLVRRPRGGLLGGMWAFPEREVARSGPSTAAAPVRRLARCIGLRVRGPVADLPPCEHRFTHLHAVYEPWSAGVERAAAGRDHTASDLRWVTHDEAAEFALPVAQRKVLDSWRERLNVTASRVAERAASP